MGFHHRLGDGQADARPAVVARARGVHSIEALEDARQVFVGDAGTPILDGHLQRAVVTERPNSDHPAGRAEPARVVEQVEQDLMDPLAVGLDRWKVLGHQVLQAERVIGPGHLDLRRDLVDQRPHANGLDLERNIARLEP